ncbi:MAG: dephospho-CoA kinase [Nitrospirae bacterium]|nr:dephospho-CoA kinase [Nitrospirota bacterium]
MVFAGLTGGIATGKSLVSEMFRSLGAFIIDADLIAREIVRPGLPAWKAIVEAFGSEVLLKDGNINRSVLGSIVFQDFSKRSILNSIMHPGILKEAAKMRKVIGEDHPFAVVIFDAALLIESGAYEMVDLVILVYVNEELQINRLINRDGLTREEAMDRINAQMPVEEKKEYADYVIDTSSSQRDVIEKQVRYVYEILKTLSVKDKGAVN